MSGTTELGRRGFLILIGGAISSLTLPSRKVIASETRQATVKFHESGSEKVRGVKGKLPIQSPGET